MEKDEFGGTPIQIAARNNNVEVVDMLPDHLDDVNMRDSNGLTILHRVVQCMSPVSLNIVTTLMKRKADTEIPDPQGDTALHLAAQCGNWDIAHVLLKNGARAGNTDSQGMSVLHRLTKQFKFSYKPVLKNSTEKRVSIFKLLIRNGVDIDAKDINDLTAVQIALIEKEWTMIRLLLGGGAVVDKNVSVKGKSFLHELAEDTSVYAQTARSVTQLLLTRGYNLNEREPQSDTPLNLAAKCGNWTVVSVFLKHGADASIPDSQGWFVCHRLAMDHRATRPSVERLSSILLFLKKNGFDVNQTGPDGKSCVQLSIERKKWELFRCLVECRVECCFTLHEKKEILANILRIARDNIDEKTLRSLILRVMNKDDDFCQTLAKCEQTSLEMSVLNRKWAVARVLVECGVDIRVNDGSTLTMHFLISKYRHFDHMMWLSFLDALLARGADINSRDKDGKTFLFQICAQYGQDGFDSLIHALLDRGANPLLADSTGKSVLRCTLDLTRSLVLKALVLVIQLGMSTHQPNLTEMAKSLHYIRGLEASPTREALKKKDIRALEMLVESGASSNRELFELSTYYQREISSRHMTGAETQMLDILNHAASQPRSLKSLCRLTVSHTLGCGPRRIDRVKSLPLPNTLQDYMLFCDLLSLYSKSKESNVVDDYKHHNYHRWILF